MNSFSYLKDKLGELVKTVPHVRVRYAYDSEFKNHIVEIKPAEVYRDDLTFAENESALCLDFSEKFPYDSIIFISEDDAVKVEHPDLVIQGILYETDSSVLNWSGIFPDDLIESPVEGTTCLNHDYALAA
jgi:hypothetical protein